ncbi:hypothetical protein [Bacillus sp. REN10]|uniref:hypothetical protein n=1 Tax=Bacillus sp. REN10 TaxID=2782541 RepID=UPI00193B7A2B|nr:hypothetical protein [Bacillus sp. REN10]
MIHSGFACLFYFPEKVDESFGTVHGPIFCINGRFERKQLKKSINWSSFSVAEEYI